MIKMMALTVCTSLWMAQMAGGQEHSKLWGRDGSAWEATGRLPDVSHAGYACGERALPRIAAAGNVRDFGAKGDGVTDDSAAFLAAISKTEKGAIIVPEGRYRISKILEITRPGIVLRGAGPERTVLVCPVPLNDIKPNWGATTSGMRTSNYSWSGGLVWFAGKASGTVVGPVTAAAKRGEMRLRVEGNTSALKQGSWIEITVQDDERKSLLDHLYSGDPGNVSKIKPGGHKTSFVTRLIGVNKGLLALERPLRIDVRPEWKPMVKMYAPTVWNSGIEDIGFEFPKRKYGGHFSELGFNAVAFTGVAHCWASNLVITNSDSGIFANGRFCTLDRILCHTDGVEENKGVFGHHGLSFYGHDNLLTHFEIRQRFIHDISVEGGAGNVISNGSGTDLCLDHHKRAPYENVFTNIDLGEGTRMWTSGGGENLGRNCGARGTFWNIRAKNPQKHPGGFGPPSINLVALKTQDPSLTDKDDLWFEAIDPERIEPADIHAAQLKRRLARK